MIIFLSVKKATPTLPIVVLPLLWSVGKRLECDFIWDDDIKRQPTIA